MVNISSYLLIESPAHPLAFFPMFWAFEDKAKSTCITIEVLRLGQWSISILLHFEVYIWGKLLPHDALKACCIYLVYKWFMYWIVNWILCNYVLEEIYVFKLVLKGLKLEFEVGIYVFPIKNCKFKFGWFSLKISFLRKTGECFLTIVTSCLTIVRGPPRAELC